MTAILKVWIEEGCITCDACEETCPVVFSVTEDSCFIKAEVREDGTFNENLDSQSHLKAEVGTSLALDIMDAAEGCPVEVIKFALVGAETPEEESEEVSTPTESAEPEPVAATPADSGSVEAEEEVEEELPPLEPSGVMGVVKVWIEEGCITCDACEGVNPEVFDVQDDTCVIRPAVMFPEFTELIQDAAEECPVDVIKFEIGDTGLFRPTKAPKEVVSEVGEGEVQILGALQPFTVPDLELKRVNATLILHRYDPEDRTVGTDEIEILDRPGNDTLYDVLSEIQMNIDGSLGLHPSDGSGHDGRCVVRVNGRLVVADRIRLVDLVAQSSRLDIQAPRGLPIIRDLLIDPQPIRSSTASAKPWMRNLNQAGRRTASGTIIGLADPLNAAEVHTISRQPSPMLAHCASDTVPHSTRMTSPPVLQHLWARMKDDRTSKEGDRHIDKILSHKLRGVFAETDLSSFARHGFSAKQAAAGILAARRNTLSRHRFSGRSGRHVKWFTKTVKSSGLLNETILAVQTLGPLGMIGNLGVTIRMATGFSRNGAPAVRDLQGFVAPGKMPKIVNSKVDEHHQVVALFSELEKRL